MIYYCVSGKTEVAITPTQLTPDNWVAPTPQFSSFEWNGTLAGLGQRGLGVFPSRTSITASQFTATGGGFTNPIELLEADYQSGTATTVKLNNADYNAVVGGTIGKTYLSATDYDNLGITEPEVWGRADSQTFWTPNQVNYGSFDYANAVIIGPTGDSSFTFTVFGRGMVYAVMPYNTDQKVNGNIIVNSQGTDANWNGVIPMELERGSSISGYFSAAARFVPRKILNNKYWQIANGGIDDPAQVSAAEIVAQVAQNTLDLQTNGVLFDSGWLPCSAVLQNADRQVLTHNLGLTGDMTNYECHIYCKAVQANNGYAVGDVVEAVGFMGDTAYVTPVFGVIKTNTVESGVYSNVSPIRIASLENGTELSISYNTAVFQLRWKIVRKLAQANHPNYLGLFATIDAAPAAIPNAYVYIGTIDDSIRYEAGLDGPNWVWRGGVSE